MAGVGQGVQGGKGSTHGGHETQVIMQKIKARTENTSIAQWTALERGGGGGGLGGLLWLPPRWCSVLSFSKLQATVGNAALHAFAATHSAPHCRHAPRLGQMCQPCPPFYALGAARCWWPGLPGHWRPGCQGHQMNPPGLSSTSAARSPGQRGCGAGVEAQPNTQAWDSGRCCARSPHHTNALQLTDTYPVPPHAALSPPSQAAPGSATWRAAGQSSR